MNPTAITHFVSTLSGLGPDVLALLGALGTLGVALQAVLLVLGRWSSKAAKAAGFMGVVVTDLGKIGSVIGKLGKAGVVSLVFLAVSCSCTPADRAAIESKVPTLSQVQSVASTLEHAAALAELAGADVSKVRDAITHKDPYAAVGALRDALDLAAKAGHPVPPEIVALVNTAEGALAAQAVAEGMQALSVDHDAGRP